MTSADARQRAGDAWEQRAWAQARDALTELGRSDALDPPELQRLAVASYLSGDDADSLRAWSRAYQALIGAGELPAAARCALWQAFQLFSGGETARGGGWLARAQRLLDDCRHECAEHGFVQSLTALQLIRAGDPAGAQAAFAGAVRIGQRFGDSDVMSLGRLGQGQALAQLGQLDEGMALLDEVMVSVTSNEVSPLVSGLAYCAMIGFCREIFDVRRAAEWTVALSNWCGTQPELVAYRGQCLIHRSELLQLRGEWPDAMVEARAARERLSQPSPHPALGSAWYQQAELHRLRGEFGEAEDAYRETVRWGHPPQPGFALLRLAQGRNDAARTVISRLLDDTSETSERSRLLPAFVEICLATSDVPGARAGADELGRIADERDAPYVTAMASHAIGSVLLAEADLSAAYVSLSRAGEIWQELDVPYEGARARALIAQVCSELGDADSAELQLAAARAVFAEVGAAPDLARLDRASARTQIVSGGLTVRELEVLRQLASGQTNRAIAEQLVISEKTVARHVSNIFAKLGLSSRAAATAYAYENQLV